MEDTYRTIEAAADGLFKDKSSRFISFAYPISSAEQVKELVGALRTKYYDARHWCYAYRVGFEAQEFRANDDGEPSGTAGRPILGQLQSMELTNVLVVVVRYFGGIKLGVPGLIAAYRAATQDVLSNCQIVQRTKDARVRVEFSYLQMNSVMKVVKELEPKVAEQVFDNSCTMELTIRESKEPQLVAKLTDVEGLSLEHLGYQ